jgi:radical SAM/Cys-rich protein
MDRRTVDRCLDLLERLPDCRNLDITGGSPELHPLFEHLVTGALARGKHVAVRHNLTITQDGVPRSGDCMKGLPEFFARNRLEVLASLPHYTAAATDCVRGQGVFAKSIASLRQLNALGYGIRGELMLNLVYNHTGPITEARRRAIEADFRRALAEEYGVVFNSLMAVTNMPVNRFRASLLQQGLYRDYMENLVQAFSPAAAANVACRRLVSIGYDGQVYDCDFNQALGLPADGALTVFDFDLDRVARGRIAFGSHCFGCTAGGGSS